MQEDQYAQYPRPPKGEIDFAIVGEAFQLTFKHWLPMMTASFIGYFIPYCIFQVTTIYLQFQLGMMSPTASIDPTEIFAKTGQLYSVMIPMALGIGVVLAPFGYAITKMTLKSVYNEPVEFSDVFCGFSKFGRSLAAVVGTYLLAMIGTVACCIGAPIVGGLLMFTLPLVVDRGMPPMEAMRTSFEMLRPHIWMAMLLYIIFTVLSGLGALACLVGVVVTFPVFFVIPALAYRDFTRGPSLVESPQIQV